MGGTYGQGRQIAAIATNNQSTGIFSDMTANLTIIGANLQNNGTGGTAPGFITSSPNPVTTIITGSVGYKTETSGEVVLRAGSTSLLISLGLDAPDLTVTFSVTPVTSPSAADVSSFWVFPPAASSPGSPGALTLNVNSAPTTDIYYVYSAKGFAR